MAKKRHMVQLSAVREIADPRADVHQAAVINIATERLWRALRRLSVLERRVIVLRYGLYGTAPMTTRQVARSLGCSVGRAWEIEWQALRQLGDDEPLRAVCLLPEAA